MNRFVLLLSLLMITVSVSANTAPQKEEAHSQLIATAWKAQQAPKPQQLKHDLSISYAGPDISTKTDNHPQKIMV